MAIAVYAPNWDLWLLATGHNPWWRRFALERAVCRCCGVGVSRDFLSHSSCDNRQAVAVKKWLIKHEPGLTDEIFLDLDPHIGIRPGERWKQALNQASARCEAVGLAQSAVSKHLACLRDCGLVASDPVGRASLFRLTQPALAELLGCAETVLAATGNAVALCLTYGMDTRGSAETP